MSAVGGGGGGPSVASGCGGGGGAGAEDAAGAGVGRGPGAGITNPSGTFTLPGTRFGSLCVFSSLSSSTLPSCTFFFFPSKSSSSDLSRLVFPCNLVARSLLKPEVFSPFVSPRELTRN